MIEVQEHKWHGNNDSQPNCEREESLKKETKNSSDKVVSLKNVEQEDTIIDVHGVRHSKKRLQRAIDQFDKKVVELKEEFFEQAINQIEEVVEKVIVALREAEFPLSFSTVNPQCFYELIQHNEVDIYLVIENISGYFRIVDDAKTPKGYTQVKASSTTFETLLPLERKLVKEFCIRGQSGEYYLSPKAICRELASCVSNLSQDILEDNAAQHARRHPFYNIPDGDVVTSSVSPYIVNLIPTLHLPGCWPGSASWLQNCNRKWPGNTLKEQVLNGGIHLVPSPETELWKISFCNARRCLLQTKHLEDKGRCLKILQVIAESDLCRPKALLPLHMENIFLWASKRFCSAEDWSRSELPQRFLEILDALYNCLWNGDCHDFFIPTINLFANLNENSARILASKVEDILIDPYKYLSFSAN